MMLEIWNTGFAKKSLNPCSKIKNRLFKAENKPIK